MIRGNRCTICHKVFVGVDIELMATVLAAPVQCPKCGGKHTLPLLAPKHEYECIWKTMNEKN